MILHALQTTGGSYVEIRAGNLRPDAHRQRAGIIPGTGNSDSSLTAIGFERATRAQHGARATRRIICGTLSALPYSDRESGHSVAAPTTEFFLRVAERYADAGPLLSHIVGNAIGDGVSLVSADSSTFLSQNSRSLFIRYIRSPDGSLGIRLMIVNTPMGPPDGLYPTLSPTS